MSSFRFVASATLAALSVLNAANAQNATNYTMNSQLDGQSPPVYPSPRGMGTGNWASAYDRAAALVAQMTNEEKVNLTFGVDVQPNGCSGNIAAVPRLGFPGMCLTDAGNGVRATDFVNGYPSGLHVGAAWNKDLAYKRALYMGGEFRTKGVNVALGPVVGPLGRVALGGRNWEGFSNDPYLCGSLAFETVRGVQENGVITSLKHYIGNEQEYARNPVTTIPGNSTAPVIRESISSNIDDKAMHELYLWPFQDGVHAGTANIMCSYNRLNNSHGCQNSKALNGLLKTELGFEGFVVSDWFAQHSGVASALAGLDMAMPNSPTFWANGLLLEAIANGTVPQSRLDDMATRIIAAWYHLGQDQGFPAPGVGMAIALDQPHAVVDARNPAARTTLLQGALEGHVLVKNTNNALPLRSPKLLSIYGYDAAPAPESNIAKTGSSFFAAPWVLGFQSANISVALPGFLNLLNLDPFPQTAYQGTITSGGGSGANAPAYISDPYSALVQRAIEDGSSIFYDFQTVNSTSAVDAASDACLVFINAFSTEGYDRSGLHDDFSDALVMSIADQCNNTIVVIHNAGIRLVDQWIDHPNVTAVIYAHVPGQDSGRALVQLLYGELSPSGKLPYTVAKNESDYGRLYAPDMAAPPFLKFPQSDFSEGVYIDYRAFDAMNITPRFEFGFGLSYANFSYSNLQVSKLAGTNTAEYPSGPIREGGETDLWDVLATVSCDITNTAAVDGAEVGQLYVGIPGGPLKQLRGYGKVDITPGQTVSLNFDLTRRDLSTWNVEAQAWQLQSADYNIYVGASSRNLPLIGTLSI